MHGPWWRAQHRACVAPVSGNGNKRVAGSADGGIRMAHASQATANGVHKVVNVQSGSVMGRETPEQEVISVHSAEILNTRA